jgi:putative spermidine/putrescine transport system substrate-binding protein
MAFINFAISAERQAGMSKAVPYGPGNVKAFDHLTDAEARDLNTSPDNMAKQFWWDVEWWGAPRASDGKTPREYLAEDYAAWMVKG